MDKEIIFEEIINEYEKQRAANIRERDERVKEVYEKLPEISEIDKKISKIGSDTLNAILSEPNKKGLKEDMKSKFKILLQERREILEKNNIDVDFDKIKYKCEKCEDTGYEEGKGRCSCFNQKIINSLYKFSNMNDLLKTQNFDSFNAEYYSKSRVSGLEKTPYENIMNIKKYCMSYVENFDDNKKSLLFYGDTGVGKTFMSSCIAKALMDKGRTVLYIRAARLFKLFEDERFGRLRDDIDDIYSSDLLIIDDLGTEADSRNNNSYLMELINERMITGRKMIINTNLNFENLEKKYTKRFSSRLLENFIMMYFYGEDIRHAKLMRGNR